MNRNLEQVYILIDKNFSGTASKEEENRLHNWKSSSVQNKKVYDELIYILELVSGLQDWKIYNKKQAWKRFLKSIGERSFLFSWKTFGIVAASLMLISSIIGFNHREVIIPYAVKNLNGSEINYSVLKDGTELYLEENALIQYRPFNIDERIISTEGSYFISVEKDRSRPFRIETQNVSIEVLGTSFKVEESEELTSVAVREGKVKICTESDLCYTVNGNERCIVRENSIKIEKINSWDWGLWNAEYNDAKLETLLLELEAAYNNFDIDYDNISGDCKFTSKFSNTTAIEILDELSLLMNLQYYLEDGKIVISDISC